MPRVTKKERRLARCERMAVNDITLSDFANAPMSNPSGHVRKCVVNVQLDAKNINKVSNLGTEDLSWFEKDLDDFEITTEPTERGDEAPLSPKKTGRFKQGKQLQVVKAGIDYPDDLWYQLSRFIYPESVATFSRLCKSTHRIVNTISFWRYLYDRYYNTKVKIPKALQPLCLERIHGLHANVVRALFHFYPPYIQKISTARPFEDEPHKLVGQRCLLLWYQPVKNLWNFCFKLVKPGIVQQSQSVCRSQHDFMVQYDDILYNTEVGCTILQVTCSHFLSVPIVMGLVLNRVQLTVGGQGMHQTLRLQFDTRYQHQTNIIGTTVVLDSVVNIRVIPWWNPKYPFTT